MLPIEVLTTKILSNRIYLLYGTQNSNQLYRNTVEIEKKDIDNKLRFSSKIHAGLVKTFCQYMYQHLILF